MASELKVDTISEKTTASGVTIDGVLVKDGAIASSYISGLTDNVGLKAAQTWRLTANITTTNYNDITTNLEVPDTENQGNLGTLVSHSSGIFSFSETGYYAIMVGAFVSGGKQTHITTNATDDNSTYSSIAQSGVYSDTDGTRSAFSMAIVDVTDTSLCKIKFQSYIQAAGGALLGSTTQNYCYFTFLKLGET